MNRRLFIRRVIAGGAGAALGTSLVPLAACNGSSTPDAGPVGRAIDFTPRRRTPSGPTREVRLTAAAGEVEVAPGQVYRTWMYNGEYPGPEIRLTEGERIVVTLENELPEETTIHWHGIPVPNDMDGVPRLTQEPIAPGESYTYDFVAEPAGTYIYHSHVGLQIDRGLVAPIVVEERDPHVDYDREYTLFLDDYLPGDPEPLGRGGMMDDGRMRPGRGRMGPGMMGVQVPPYDGLMINSRLPADPDSFEIRRGERLRLRLMNPSGATTYRFGIQEHPLTVTHADGQPVEPVTVDSLDISMGERYDVIVEGETPGAWAIVATPLEGDSPPARAILNYADANASEPSTWAAPSTGRSLRLVDLQSLQPAPTGTPDRVFDLTLSGGMMMGQAWTINGQTYPDADPLEVNLGETARFRMINRSPMIHPMHLHGHFFRVGDVMKDTVLVPPHMGRVTFDFVADNPGRWLFHCHNIYHLEAGMAREVRVL